MATYYDRSAIKRLMRGGMGVKKSKTYAFWVWAKEGAHVHLHVGEHHLAPTHTGNASSLFSWKKAGEVALKKGTPIPVAIKTLHGLGTEERDLGYVAVSDHPGFDPDRSFELTRIHPDRAGQPNDERLRSLRHGSMYYTFPAYRNKTAWLTRAAYLRQHILVSLGLWPMPEKEPLNAQVFGRMEYEGYTIEKVYFESYPGFYVTGNLYRPRGKDGPFPGIICPHGHWKHGRLEHSEDGSVPGRCINFARQGYVAFAYDMIGYNDSFQLEHHGGSLWQALWGISRMGLQLWNSIRSVDFITSLEDVDADRIGCTGASGGGTQAYALMAVDERIKVAAPVCMVSSIYQGGCVCENGPNLRLDTFNTELAALMAPRPLLLVGVTGDWTQHTPEVEYPAIRSIYRLFDAEDKVDYAYFDVGHNYNKDTREAVYTWFGRWLLGITDEDQLKEQVEEQPFTVPPKEQMLVFHGIDRPANALDEEGLTQLLIGQADGQLEFQMPRNRYELKAFRDTMSIALQHTLAASYPGAAEVTGRVMGRIRRAKFVAEPLLIGRAGQGDQIPAMLYSPKGVEATPAVLLVHPEGKAAFVDTDQGVPGKLVVGLLQSGVRVLVIDTFLTGEFHSPFGRSRREQDVPYYSTFNRTDMALRVQDILTSLAYLDAQAEGSDIRLAGFGLAGLWALLARGLSPCVERAVIDVDGFDVADYQRWLTDMFVPGLRCVGGFDTAGILAAPARLVIHYAKDVFDTAWISDVYLALDAEDALTIKDEQASEDDVLSWLTEE